MDIKVLHFGRTGDCVQVLSAVQKVLEMDNLSDSTKALLGDIMETVSANSEIMSTENSGNRIAVKLGMALALGLLEEPSEK